MYKKGFTIAEMLITIAIIGVIASLTLPAILSKQRKKETEIKLKHTYSMLSQALLMAQKDYGDPETWDFVALEKLDPSNVADDTESITKKYILPYIHSVRTKEYDSLSNLGYKIYHTPQGTLGSYFSNANEEFFIIELLSGITLFFKLNGIDFLIFIDTTGDNPPNVWGKDLFMAHINSKGRFRMFNNGSSALSEAKAGCSPDSDHKTCGAWIHMESWTVPKDYFIKF